LEQVGIHDNFFELGGHSLLATRVVSRIGSVFQVDLPLRKLFEAPTVSELANEVGKLRRDGDDVVVSIVNRVDRARVGRLPLSFAQERLWFLEQLEGALTAYNMPSAHRLKGRLDFEALRCALEWVVQRHETLRTTFELYKDNPVQIISEIERFELPQMDLTICSPEKRETEIIRLNRVEADRPFNLKRDPMLRACLLRLAENEHVLLLTLHHIASDGWSIGILWRELSESYASFAANLEPDLPSLPIKYVDYALWQRDQLKGKRLKELLQYWRVQLEGISLLELPTDHARPALPSYHGARCEFEVSRELFGRLQSLARDEGATLHMTLLAVLQVLLSRYSSQTDVAVGIPSAGRNHADLEGLIGFFVNTLVVRSDLSGNPSFRVLLGRVRETSLGAYDHQDLPFEKLVEELNLERDPSRSPLFQVLFQLLDFGDGEQKLGELEIANMPSVSERVRFDLEVHLWQKPDKLSGVIVYSKDLFDDSRIVRMVGHFLTLLESVAADPGMRLNELPMLTDAERQQLLIEWNDTAVDYPDKCIHELFEEQVERAPGVVAAVFENQELTYGELNKQANRLAHSLIEKGVGNETLVAICVERSLEMIVSLLAILKAGGVYVPLDPDYPEARLTFILEDCREPLLLTTEALSKHFTGFEGDRLILNEDSSLTGQSDENPRVSTDPENLAYVIYTSGSTGYPKGVEIPHRGVVRLVCENDYCRFDCDRVFLQFAPVSFDAATFEIWGALLHGARLVIAPPGRYAIDRIPELIAQHRITTAWLTAGLFNQFVDGDSGVLSGIEELLIGGEILSTKHVSKALKRLPGTRIINGYGPTEITTFASTFRIERGEDYSTIPIGKPIANTQVYILDKALHPLPIGITGELYIGGAGLARGYLNQPELTAERFIEIEVLGKTERVYRTGDLCRWRADGNLEFLGRIDQQIKIRGFRIELGEIEAVLSTQLGIMESVVLAREDTLGEKRLVAYVVLDQENPTSTVALRRALAEKLPGYMLPTAYVSLDTLPLTTNGKLDRNALPVPELDRSAAGVVYTAPRTPIEESLASIWKEVLGLKQVGIHDDFFELGGHSLQATRVVSRIGLVFEVNLPLRRLFDAPTIHNLANSINLLRGDEVVQPCSKRQVAPITIHRGLGNTEVFLFHGGDGGSLPFLPLTRFMDPHASIFAFEHPALHDWEEDPESSVTELADRYTDALLMRTVSGPYIIAGWSFGGLVAHEVAHRLIDQGKEVGLLALLDSYLPIQGSKPASEGTLMRKFLRGWGVIDTVIDSHFDETVHFTEAASVRLIQQCIRDSVTKTRAVSDQLIERQFQVYRNAVLAARGYVPRRGYPGRITQFRALESIRAGALGWESVEASQLEIFDVPGDHYSMLLDPNVAGLGQMINERLDGNPLLTKI